MHLVRRPASFLALGVAAALAVTACSDGDSGGDDATSAGTDAPAETPADDTSGDTSGTDAPTSVPDETDPPTTETPTTDPDDTDPPTTDVATTTTAARVYDFSAIGPAVQNGIDAAGLDGAGLIVVDDEDGVIHEEYWGDFDADRISLIASSSKMIVAGVLMRLHDDGLLDVDAPVAAAVEWGAGNPDITPAQLVSNSSGLVGLLPDPGYTPYICQFLATGTLQECGEAIFTAPDDDADIAPPDSEFRYGGAQWQVAGAVAEAVSGKSWAELIDEIYVEPCGLETLAFNNHWTQLGSAFDYPTEFDSDPSILEPTNNPNMEGGAYVTTGDYAKLLLMHLRGGMCDDEAVLSQESLDRMHADRIGEVYDGSAGPNTGYGMGWWVDRESGLISDPGAFGALPWLDLEDGYGAYLVVEAGGDARAGFTSELYRLVDAAVNGATSPS